MSKDDALLKRSSKTKKNLRKVANYMESFRVPKILMYQRRRKIKERSLFVKRENLNHSRKMNRQKPRRRNEINRLKKPIKMAFTSI